MSYDACDIDKLRDLVRRQHNAKTRYYSVGSGDYGTPALSAEEIERQVTTYLGQGTTVAALTKCVEGIEREATARVSRERETAKKRAARQQAHTVLNRAIDLAEGRKDAVTIQRSGSSYYGATEDFICAAKAVKEWIGSPWADEL